VHHGGMPRYDVRCRACGSTFEVTRTMAAANDPAPCPHGHDDTVRLLPTVAVTGVSARGGAGSPASGPMGGSAGGSAGGCCGGGCCG
jgi:putative FmdB family regulatory protein